MKRRHHLLALLVECLGASACRDPAEGPDEPDPEELDVESEDDDGTDDAGNDEPSVCGDGIVAAEEQCDGSADGEPCDDRCRIPGTVQWTWEHGHWIEDLGIGPHGLLVCGSTLSLVDLDGLSAVELETPPGEGCERLAIGPSGAFAALAWEDAASPERAAVTAYEPEGAVRWTVPAVAITEANFRRPALAVGPDDSVVVAGTFEPDLFETYARVVQFDSKGDPTWTFTRGDANPSQATAVAVAPNGQVVVGGGGPTPFVPGATLVLALDEGQPIYAATHDFSADQYDAVSSVLLPGNGSVVIAGRYESMLYLVGLTPPSKDLQWQRELSAVGTWHGADLAFHPSGHVAVAWRTETSWNVELIDGEGNARWNLETEVDEDWGHISDVSLAIDERGDMFVSFADETVLMISSPLPVEE